MHVVAQEHHGEFLSEQGVQMLAGKRKLFGTAVYEHEVLHADDALQGRHVVLVEVFPHLVAHEQQFGFAVVYDVVHIVRLEFVQNGDDDCAIGDGGQERHAPVSAVASAEGYLVAGLDAGGFEHQVKLGDFPCHVFILQAFAVEVREGLAVPVLFDAVLYELY